MKTLKTGGWSAASEGVSRRLILSAGLVLAAGCLYDPNQRCSDHEIFSEASGLCHCAEGFVPASAGTGCVACGEHEVSAGLSCSCVSGFARTSSGSCGALPAGQGASCDESMRCSPTTEHTYCHLNGSGTGYCTTAGCTSNEQCEGGYACELGATQPFCARPPTGQGKHCTTSGDCAGGEATYCETFSSFQCLVEDCVLQPDSCFSGFGCCDLSALGVPKRLCLKEGMCPTR